LKKPYKNGQLLSITDLAEKFGKDRATIRRLLRNIPYTVGPKGRHLYDSEAASAAIDAALTDTGDILHERLLKVQAERRLREIQLAEKQKDMIKAEDFLAYVKEITIALRAVIDSWPEEHRRRAEIAIWRAGAMAGKVLGNDDDIAMQEKEIADAERQLALDIKNGAVPEYFWHTVVPENACRVWSQELNRYYTKAEIIAKFGPQAQISPIDEILAESVQLES